MPVRDPRQRVPLQPRESLHQSDSPRERRPGERQEHSMSHQKTVSVKTFQMVTLTSTKEVGVATLDVVGVAEEGSEVVEEEHGECNNRTVVTLYPFLATYSDTFSSLFLPSLYTPSHEMSLL